MPDSSSVRKAAKVHADNLAAVIQLIPNYIGVQGRLEQAIGNRDDLLRNLVRYDFDAARHADGSPPSAALIEKLIAWTRRRPVMYEEHVRACRNRRDELFEKIKAIVLPAVRPLLDSDAKQWQAIVSFLKHKNLTAEVILELEKLRDVMIELEIRWIDQAPLPATAANDRNQGNVLSAADSRATSPNDTPQPSAHSLPIDNRKLPLDAQAKALFAMIEARRNQPEVADDPKAAWRWLKENGAKVDGRDYLLPKLSTFCRYIRAAKKRHQKGSSDTQ